VRLPGVYEEPKNLYVYTGAYTEFVMPHRAPLNAARLAEIYDEEPTPVVVELLWEIHRLRATILRAHQVLSSIGHQPVGVPQIVWQTFIQTIEAEPCLRDPLTPRQQRTLEQLRGAALRRASR
jgi:hypothetical protein